MFCLRSWIPILFFLYAFTALNPGQTNASPIYLLLFITATYVLNRPCVYCSLLLAILVLSLFDFHTSWFPQPGDCSASSPSSLTHDGSNGTVCAHAQTPLSATTSALVATLNSTLEALVSATAEEIKKRLPDSVALSALSATNSTQGAAAGQSMAWWKEIVSKREWRVPCLDVLVRL